ncbi:ribokinase [Falsirhodobacter sp. 20TX0035]|uniref:ribokinase n=1 Tax=Falsirhodobacter sp. 20TX0035 TaxID=3022019 RepID=UPI00232D2A58|nr:ribokinase [Falsirhodobacter sp. 20TX0035]MDB6452746.1 ribokinase [Falsirhodobacter sp. 20TX0035]
MAIWTFGSINLDHVYRVPHFVAAGETLAAASYQVGLGGKGANQSVAAARAGAHVRHVGAVGRDGQGALDSLRGFGVDVSHVTVGDIPTGHAIINVDPKGENSIVVFDGANRALDTAHLAALGGARPGDTLLLQNETSLQVEAARAFTGSRIIYSAAPFEAEAVRRILPHISLLVMNAGEAEALRAAMGSLPQVEMVITRGADGADWIGAKPLHVPAFPVTPVDTTGAGDCFTGTLAAALDRGLPPFQAMRRAAAAAALQVTRPGAAGAMPTAAEVDALL